MRSEQPCEAGQLAFAFMLRLMLPQGKELPYGSRGVPTASEALEKRLFFYCELVQRHTRTPRLFAQPKQLDFSPRGICWPRGLARSPTRCAEGSGTSAGPNCAVRRGVAEEHFRAPNLRGARETQP